MKIALCLCGVVGNAYTNKDDRIWTHDVDYRLGLEYYQKRLFAANQGAQFDVFIHSWSIDYEAAIRRDYQPKACLFEPQIDFGKHDIVRHFNRSRWYSTRASVELKRAWEQEHGFVYDWVILARFDIAFFKDLILSNYDPDYFYAGYHKWQAETLFVQEEPKFCDMFYYAASAKIDAFSLLYDDLVAIKNEDPHWQSLIQAKRLDFKLRSDFRHVDEYELVRYVYQDCHYRGDDYPGEAGFARQPKYPLTRLPHLDSD